MKRSFQKSTRLFVPCVAFPGPENIYKPNLAPIASGWNSYASSTQAVQSSGSSVGSSCSSFRSLLQMDCHRCCEVAVAFTVITITKKDNIIHDHSYLLSTCRCQFIYATPSVLAHSVMLYYILQTLLLPYWGSGDETSKLHTIHVDLQQLACRVNAIAFHKSIWREIGITTWATVTNHQFK